MSTYRCQYCDEHRICQGWMQGNTRDFPVSLCQAHKRQHAADFYKFTPVDPDEVEREADAS